MSWNKNRMDCLPTKKIHVELMSETMRQFFSDRKEMASKKSPPQSQIWPDICSTLYFPNENPWVKLPLIYLTIFLSFDRKWYLKATNNCTRRFTRHYLFYANRHNPLNRCGCVFHQREIWLHQNVLCWRKYEFIFASLYILQMSIRERSHR